MGTDNALDQEIRFVLTNVEDGCLLEEADLRGVAQAAYEVVAYRVPPFTMTAGLDAEIREKTRTARWDQASTECFSHILAELDATRAALVAARERSVRLREKLDRAHELSDSCEGYCDVRAGMVGEWDV